MATKATLEKELEDTKELLKLAELESKNRLHVLSDANKKALEVSAERDALTTERDELLKDVKSLGMTTPETLELPEDQKAQLVRLSVFLQSLYRESEYPPVKQDILDWRRLLGSMTD